MAEPDIQVLVGLLGGGGISEGSGRLIATQLSRIMDKLSQSKAAKFDLGINEIFFQESIKKTISNVKGYTINVDANIKNIKGNIEGKIPNVSPSITPAVEKQIGEITKKYLQEQQKVVEAKAQEATQTKEVEKVVEQQAKTVEKVAQNNAKQAEAVKETVKAEAQLEEASNKVAQKIEAQTSAMEVAKEATKETTAAIKEQVTAAELLANAYDKIKSGEMKATLPQTNFSGDIKSLDLLNMKPNLDKDGLKRIKENLTEAYRDERAGRESIFSGDSGEVFSLINKSGAYIDFRDGIVSHYDELGNRIETELKDMTKAAFDKLLTHIVYAKQSGGWGAEDTQIGDYDQYSVGANEDRMWESNMRYMQEYEDVAFRIHSETSAIHADERKSLDEKTRQLAFIKQYEDLINNPEEMTAKYAVEEDFYTRIRNKILEINSLKEPEDSRTTIEDWSSQEKDLERQKELLTYQQKRRDALREIISLFKEYSELQIPDADKRQQDDARGVFGNGLNFDSTYRQRFLDEFNRQYESSEKGIEFHNKRIEQLQNEIAHNAETTAAKQVEADNQVVESSKRMAAERVAAEQEAQEATQQTRQLLTEGADGQFSMFGAVEEDSKKLAESQRQIGISAQQTKDQVTNAAQAEVEAIENLKEESAEAAEQLKQTFESAAESNLEPESFLDSVKKNLVEEGMTIEEAEEAASEINRALDGTNQKLENIEYHWKDTEENGVRVFKVIATYIEKANDAARKFTQTTSFFEIKDEEGNHLGWDSDTREKVSVTPNDNAAQRAKDAAAALKEEEKALKSIVALRNQIAASESVKVRPNVGKNEAAGIDLDIDEKQQEIERLFSRLSEITGKSRAELEATVGIIEKQTAAYADTERQIGRNKDAAVSAAEKERVATLKALADIKSARDKVLELRHKATQSGVDTDETRQLTDIIKKYDELKKQYDSGKISVDQYKEEVLGLKSTFSAVSGAVKTQIAVQGNFKKEIEQTAQKILSLEREANDYLVKSEKPGISTESAAEYKAAYEEREAAAKSLIGTLQGLMGVELNEVSSYLDSLRGASSNYRKFAEGMNANDESRKKKIYEQKAALAQLNNQLEQYIKTMKKSGAPADKIQKARDFIGDNNDWIKLLESGEVLPDQKIREATAAIRDFIAASREAGDAQETLGHQIMRVFSQKFGYAVMATLAMQVRKAIRQIYTNVVELDTAMTELRKVTDETAASYERFLENAAQGAQKLGVSMTELVNATADFARLGYNIVDANTLAEVATVYKNVGDGITSIDEASSSIISTMKAFKMEASDAMSIVDKFNIVGNRFAISSGGIGEALTRSASSLAVANNSLDESIALITAANTVVQSPETVGVQMPNDVVIRRKNTAISVNSQRWPRPRKDFVICFAKRG